MKAQINNLLLLVKKNYTLISGMALIVAFALTSLSFFNNPEKWYLHPSEPVEIITHREGPFIPYEFRIALHITPPINANDPVIIKFRELEYSISEQIPVEETNGKQLCITSITLLQTATFVERNQPANILAEDFTDDNSWICVDPRGGFISPDDVSKTPGSGIRSFNTGEAFYYPYDDFMVDFYVEIYYTVVEKDDPLEIVTTGSAEPSTFLLSTDKSNWLYAPINRVYEYKDGDYSYSMDVISMYFARPEVSRVLPPIAVGLIALAIFGISFVKELSTFIEGSVAILFGIFGIRQAILPANIDIQTAWDSVFVNLYIFLGGTCLLFIVRIMPERKKKKATPKYFVNSISGVVHRSDCSRAANIAESNRSEIPTLDDAKAKNYKFCKSCLPAEQSEK